VDGPASRSRRLAQLASTAGKTTTAVARQHSSPNTATNPNKNSARFVVEKDGEIEDWLATLEADLRKLIG